MNAIGMRVSRSGSIKNSPLGNLWTFGVWALVVFFVINLLAMIASVVVNSFGTRWLGTWLPEAWTFKWYVSSWKEFQLTEVLSVTFQLIGWVVLISALIGIPAAYALARRRFPGRNYVMLLLVLPLLTPPITFGIPLATLLYQAGLGSTMQGIVLANLVPAVPFVVLILIPFVEQIDQRVEDAARVFGANTFQFFIHVLVPLLLPGILAALLLLLVRTASMFELSFLTAATDTQTLVVALYYAVFSPGVRPGQSIDAMAVIYMLSTLIWLVIALRFVNPAQMASRSR
jgi:putative spermidine/putrescine transport system permease protein